MAGSTFRWQRTRLSTTSSATDTASSPSPYEWRTSDSGLACCQLGWLPCNLPGSNRLSAHATATFVHDRGIHVHVSVHRISNASYAALRGTRNAGIVML